MQGAESLPLGPLVTGPFGDRYFHEINGHSFQHIDADTIYRQRYHELLTKENTLHVIIGTDSGLLPLFIARSGPAQGSRYLFVELEVVDQALTEQRIYQNPPPENIRVVVQKDFPETADKAGLTDFIFLDSIRVWDSLSVCDAKLAGYRELSSQIKQTLNAAAYDVIMGLGSKNFINKQIKNLSENRIPAGFLNKLTADFSGKTAVILGGGPSLDEFLPWVKENRDQLAIFAVSRIAGNLLENGLVPHFIVSIDPADANFHISREMLLFPETPILIHANHVNPLLLSSWSGPSIYLAPRFPWDTPLNAGNLAPWGPTVTNTALGVVAEMGFGQAVLIGVDLCFDRTGITHAAGSHEYVSGPKLDATITVKTNAGDIAETGADYYSAIGYLAKQAAEAKKQGCRVISPAPNAAQIENIAYLPVNDLTIEALNNMPVDIVLSAMPAESGQTRQEDGQRVLAELEGARKQLKDIAVLCRRALKNTQKLLTPNRHQLHPQYKDKINKIDKTLDTDFPAMTKWIKGYGIRSFLRLKTANGRKRQSAHELQSHLDSYFRTLRDTADELIEIVEDAIRRVGSRIEEEASHPDFKRVTGQWQADRHWFRVRVWKKRHPEQPYFADWLDATEVKLKERLQEKQQTNNFTSLKGVQNKALNLFSRRDASALARLAQGLAQHPDKTAAAELLHLVHGYSAELSEDWDMALGFYQQLVGDVMTPPAEESLRRISVICLRRKNLEMAALALECLSQCSPVYKVKYADFLCTIGRRQEAADFYVDYLDQVPVDMEVLLKLGKNYRAMGAEDAAQKIFRLALQQQPGNKAVLSLLQNN